MEQRTPVNRFGGILLAAGGVIFAIAGALHPHSTGGDSRQVIAQMLRNPAWPAAHWLAFGSMVSIVLAIWLLADDRWAGGSVLAQAGNRLAIIGGLFMMVEFTVELAARGAASALVSGQTIPMANLFTVTHAAGWPTLGAGFILLALGLCSAPVVVRIIGTVGAAAVGLAGILVAGFGLLQVSFLFLGGELLAFWIIWTGIQTARGRVSPRTGGTE